MTAAPSDFVWGHVGGEADSVSKFVPECTACGRAMQFVVQLEQGPVLDTAFNFNGTTACAYLCIGCFGQGTFFVDDFY